MSTAVFPSFPGQSPEVIRTPIWNTTLTESASGKETAISNWTYPRWQWQVSYEVLRSDIGLVELQTLQGFFNSRRGRFDSFLYQDETDNAVTGQGIALGDGTTTTFQLVRSYGGFVEPIFAPHAVSKVYVDGVDKAGHWTVSNWGTSTPGIVTFDAAPASGKAITADFSFYFPCRFADDQYDFSRMMVALFSQDGIKFRSIK